MYLSPKLTKAYDVAHVFCNNHHKQVLGELIMIINKYKLLNPDLAI